MFSTEHLNNLRLQELERIVRHFEPGARILEIGAGTGQQALELAGRGYRVDAIELATSNYAHERLFPIVEYDGRNIPFATGSFDIVFSSNVLEHVPDLEQLNREMARVLKPGGACVHVLPTHAWRFWTTLAAVPDAIQSVGTFSDQLVPRPRGGRGEVRRLASVWLLAARRIGGAFLQRRHGERGNVVSELYYFHPSWWRRSFARNGFTVELCEPMGLFYTGSMLLGSRWSFAGRERWSRRLGSACCLFKLRPAAGA